MRLLGLCAWICGGLAAVASVRADTISDFYAGKTVTIVVGSDAGGGYDTQAHLMARHLGDFLPGKPNVVVQNMPGAGSINAANFLYNSAPRDGSTLGMIQRTLFSANLTNQKGVRFEVAKFNWIGNLATETPIFVSWHTSPVKTMKDLLEREMVLGGGGPSSDSEVQSRMLNALLGTKIKIVSGYPGQAQIQLAMERGEVEAVGAWGWSNLKSRNANYLTDHKVNILLQGALERAKDLPDTPTPFDFVKDPTARQILEVFYAQQNVARPVLAPPGTPAERVTALRAAFDAMVADKSYADDAKKLKLDVDATDWRSIEKVIEIISATPPDVAARYAELNNAPH